MERLPHLLVLLMVFCLIAADEKKAEEEKKKESSAQQEKLQGKWNITTIQEDGKSKENMAELQLSVTGDKLTLRSEKEGIDLIRDAVFTLDESKSPAEIDWKLTVDGREHTWHGIYGFEGEKLKLCWCGPGSTRPKQFITTAGDGCFFYELMKAK